MDYYYELLNSYSKLKKRTLVLKEEETASKEKTYTPANPVQGDALSFFNSQAAGGAGGTFDHPKIKDKRVHIAIKNVGGRTKMSAQFWGKNVAVGRIENNQLVDHGGGSINFAVKELDKWLALSPDNEGEVENLDQKEQQGAAEEQKAAEFEHQREQINQMTSGQLDAIRDLLRDRQNQITRTRKIGWVEGAGGKDWENLIDKLFEELKTSKLISPERKLEMANTLADLAMYMLDLVPSKRKKFANKPRMTPDEFNNLLDKIAIDPAGTRIYLLDPNSEKDYQIGIFEGERAVQTIQSLVSFREDAITDNVPDVKDFEIRRPAAQSDNRNIGRRGLAAEAIRVMGTVATNIIKGGENKAFYAAKLKDLYNDAITRKETGENVSQIIINEFIAAAGFIDGQEFLTDGVESATANVNALKSFMQTSMGMSEEDAENIVTDLAEDEKKALLFTMVLDMKVTESMFGGVTPLGGVVLGGEVDAKTGESYQSRGSKADLRYFFNNDDKELSKVADRLGKLGLKNPNFVTPTEEQWEKIKGELPEGTDRESVKLLDGVSLKTVNTSKNEIVMGTGSPKAVGNEIADLTANPNNSDYSDTTRKHYSEVTSQVGESFGDEGQAAIKTLGDLTRGFAAVDTNTLAKQLRIYTKLKKSNKTENEKQKIVEGTAMLKAIKGMRRSEQAAAVAYLWSLNAHSADENAINLTHNLADNSASLTRDSKIRKDVMKGLSSGDLKVNFTSEGMIRIMKGNKVHYSLEDMGKGSIKCVQRSHSRGSSKKMTELVGEGKENTELLTLFLESQERLFKSLLERN